MKEQIHPFDSLVPELIIEAVESVGLACNGRLLALGSYENRVYQVGLEDADPVVVKFYRPGRWSLEALLEEHEFSAELQAAEVPVVGPLRLATDQGRNTLHGIGGFHFAVFPRRGGHWPELATVDDRRWLGRFLGRLHAVGSMRRFRHRQMLDPVRMGRGSVAWLLREGWIPDYLEPRYRQVMEEVLDVVDDAFLGVGQVRSLRIHGDCHRNNLLWTDSGPHFVDLDDCMNGPAVQDLWMLLAGDREEQAGQLRDLLEGYGEFARFAGRELGLIEALRSLRMIHYTAWLAQRWADPAFPLAFPWFGEARYWERHVGELEEQLSAMGQPPLSLGYH